MTAKDVDFQLVPPGNHCCNAAKRAIRTFKNHFIAGLCSVDKDFPLHLWDRLLLQGLLTLNMMRGSHLNPKLSAWAQVNGHLISIEPQLPLPASRSLSTRSPPNALPGHPMDLTAGTSVPPSIPTGATMFGSGTRVPNAYVTPLFGSQPNLACPLPCPLT